LEEEDRKVPGEQESERASEDGKIKDVNELEFHMLEQHQNNEEGDGDGNNLEEEDRKVPGEQESERASEDGKIKDVNELEFHMLEQHQNNEEGDGTGKNNGNNLESYMSAEEEEEEEEQEELMEDEEFDRKATQEVSAIIDRFSMNEFGEVDGDDVSEFTESDDEDGEDNSEEEDSEKDDGSNDERLTESSAYFYQNDSTFEPGKKDDEVRKMAYDLYSKTDKSVIARDKYGFDFSAELKIFTASQNEKKKRRPQDTVLYEGTRAKTSELAASLASHADRFNHSTADQNAMSTILHRFFPKPAYNLPIRETSKGNIIAAYREISGEHGISRTMIFDCCPQGDHIYGGQTRYSIACPECNHPRYKLWRCGNSKCSNAKYGECKHKCRKYSLRKLFYCPLELLLTELLGTKGFLLAANFRHRRFRHENTNDIQDILDGSEAKKKMAAMHERFMDKAKPNSIEVSLLVSNFYDAIQVSKSEFKNCQPLLTTILNLPPSYRGKSGIGTFLTGLYTGSYPKDKNIIESAMFTCLYIHELNTFYRGKEIIVNSNSYFVQMRLIHHSLDTVALQKVAKLKASASKSGCPLCCGIVGTWRSSLKKCYYGGHRVFLPIDHALRGIGNTQCCCPAGFWNAKEYRHKCHKNSKRCHHSQSRRAVPPKEGQPFEVCEPLSVQEINDCTAALGKKLTNNNFDLLQTGFKIQEFCTNNGSFAGMYPTADFRRQKYFTRKSDRFYHGAGIIATRDKKRTEYGVNGLWCYILLPYASIRNHVQYDAFHVLSNISDNLTNNGKGSRSKESHRNYCKNFDVHQEFANNGNQPWAVNTNEQSKIDALVNCINVPIGFKQDHAVRNIMRQSGMLKGSARISIITCFMDYILLGFTQLPSYYRVLLSALSVIVTELLSEVFIVDGSSIELQMDNLQKKIAEWLSLHESFYPDSEALIVYHQLLDLPSYILSHGPVRCWWAYYGERVLSVVRQCVKKGGQSWAMTTMNSFTRVEDSRLQDAYSFDEQSIHSFAELD